MIDATGLDNGIIVLPLLSDKFWLSLRCPLGADSPQREWVSAVVRIGSVRPMSEAVEPLRLLKRFLLAFVSIIIWWTRFV